MKRFLICMLLALFALNVQAQWYYKSYGVTNINQLGEEQLKFALKGSEKKITTGKTLTFIGAGATILGGILYVNGMNTAGDTWDDFWDSMAQAGAGLLTMSAGCISMSLGIPFWIVGANRKNSIEVALIKFNSTAFLSRNQTQYFGHNQHSAFGLSFKINF